MATAIGKTHGEHAQAWKGRGSLEAMLAELTRQRDTKIDFVADTRQMVIESETVGADEDGGGGNVVLRLCPKPGAAQLREFMPSAGVPLLDQATAQLGERCSPPVPWRFLRALRDGKPLTAESLLNDLLGDPARRLVRCLDGNVRAFLSDRYRVMDNYDLAFAALDVVQQNGGEVIECALDDRRMRLKFTSRQIFDAIDTKRASGVSQAWYAGGLGSQEYLSKVAARTGGELPGGPGTVHPLVTISNSETGHGGLNVRIGVLQAICFNLATVERVVAAIHLGEQLDAGVYSEETMSAESQAVCLKARDAIRAAFDPEKFRAIVARCNAAQDIPVEAPQSALRNVVAHTELPDEARDAVLEYFLRDYDPTAWGLAQAIGRYSQDVDDTDAAEAVEQAAGDVILKPSLAAVPA